MEEFKSKVYIKTDENDRVLRCEGGYTMSNINDINEWIYIDEGNGDKYNLCQSHYFEGNLYTEDGIPRYKYENGEAILRAEEEIAEDRANMPVPTPEGDIWAELDRAYEEGVNSI